jgi:hypothetical protein
MLEYIILYYILLYFIMHTHIYYIYIRISLAISCGLHPRLQQLLPDIISYTSAMRVCGACAQWATAVLLLFVPCLTDTEGKRSSGSGWDSFLRLACLVIIVRNHPYQSGLCPMLGRSASTYSARIERGHLPKTK